MSTPHETVPVPYLIILQKQIPYCATLFQTHPLVKLLILVPERLTLLLLEIAIVLINLELPRGSRGRNRLR
jgi:hypothetical protein